MVLEVVVVDLLLEGFLKGGVSELLGEFLKGGVVKILEGFLRSGVVNRELGQYSDTRRLGRRSLDA